MRHARKGRVPFKIVANRPLVGNSVEIRSGSQRNRLILEKVNSLKEKKRKRKFRVHYQNFKGSFNNLEYLSFRLIFHQDFENLFVQVGDPINGGITSDRTFIRQMMFRKLVLDGPHNTAVREASRNHLKYEIHSTSRRILFG